MLSAVSSRLIASDDARSGIYSDRKTGQTQDRGSDAILEHGCHRLTIRDGAPGSFAQLVYRIDKPGQILSLAVAKNITELALGT